MDFIVFTLMYNKLIIMIHSSRTILAVSTFFCIYAARHTRIQHWAFSTLSSYKAYRIRIVIYKKNEIAVVMCSQSCSFKCLVFSAVGLTCLLLVAYLNILNYIPDRGFVKPQRSSLKESTVKFEQGSTTSPKKPDTNNIKVSASTGLPYSIYKYVQVNNVLSEDSVLQWHADPKMGTPGRNHPRLQRSGSLPGRLQA